MRLRRWVIAAFALMTAGCGGATPNALDVPPDAAPGMGSDGADSDSGPEDATDGLGDSAARTTTDSSDDSTSIGADAADDGHISESDAGNDAPADAEEASTSPGFPLGADCGGNADCASSLCVAVVPTSSQVCVSPCLQQSDCNATPGFFCDPLSAGALSGYCVRRSPEHCASCTVDADCGSLSEACFLAPGDVALACHIDCSLSGASACPPDYTCTDETVAGNARELCRPNGVSDCLDAYGGFCDRVTTPEPCQRSNTDGTCAGERACLTASERFDKCGASSPTCKTDCTTPNPAGCTETFCSAATSTPENCGACGTTCPGYMQPNDNVTCDGGTTCTFSCQGENYDVDDNAANGCEVTDSPTGNHSENTAVDLGSLSCSNMHSNPNASGTIVSDARAHRDPAVPGFDATSGSAPDWFMIEATGGNGCSNDLALTLTISGSAKPSCYKLAVLTDQDTFTAQTDDTGIAMVAEGDGAYSSGTTIYLEVEKTCSTAVIEDVPYTITGHL